MAVSVAILVTIIALHVIAFVFAIGAEHRRSTVLVSFSAPPNVSFLHFNGWTYRLLYVFRLRWCLTSTTRGLTASTAPTRRRRMACRRSDSCSWASRCLTELPGASALARALWRGPLLLLGRSFSSFSLGNLLCLGLTCSMRLIISIDSLFKCTISYFLRIPCCYRTV